MTSPGDLSGPARAGIDVGGTFTDLVVIDGGDIRVAKVPSTPDDQSAGVMAALRQAGVGAGGVAVVAHGTTVATNALLERRGAPTALLTTEGFRDVIEIGRQARPSLYDLARRPPAPLVPREHRFTVRERVGPDGELVPLDEAQLAGAIEDIRGVGVDAVAVCFLFSFLDAAHERAAGEALRRALPGVRVSLSSEVLPEFREYERFSTTIADAYLAPVLDRYMGTLGQRLGGAGLPSPLVMQSSGGVTDLDGVSQRPSGCILSGPAGGVVGAAYAAGASGYRHLLTFDMGGTSTDVALVVDGEVQSTNSAVIDGIPIKHTMVDVHTISAGGGSLVWADSGGALRVGPRSAGARPGPASYGLGGDEAAVTDADLYLGYLAHGTRLGGDIVLDRSRAERALAAVGSQLGLSPLETAVGAVTVAEAEMVRALRVVSVERGLDPRDFTLVAFGGAGAMHACNLATELGTRTVLVPRAAGVLSALGLAVSDLRRDYVAALYAGVAELGPNVLEHAYAALERRARSDLARPTLRRSADLRYRGQSFELTVPADEPGRLVDNFAAAHRRRFGFELPGEEVQIVSIRLAAVVPVPKPRIPPLTDGDGGVGAAPSGYRRAYFAGTWSNVAVYRGIGHLGRGHTVKGRVIVDLPEATCVVPPGWRAIVDDAGALVLESS
jgi:N-methylhydantoinase A